MLADQPISLTFSQLFDALPDGVVYFQPVRDAEGQNIIDFTVAYANAATYAAANNQYKTSPGTSVRYDNQHDPVITARMMSQLTAIMETGQPDGFERYNPVMNEWLSVTRSKAGDGVLTITRIITASKETALKNEHQQALLTSILNTSLNSTFVYEAVRDESGQIQDFKVLLVNERGRQDVIKRLGIDPQGKTLLTINPDSKEKGQFNVFCKVIDTGAAVQLEQFYPNVQECWYNTAITKLNDGVVVTGIDITTQKQNALEAERQSKAIRRQSNFVNSVLDGSISGIVAVESIRNPSDEIVDFRFLTANQAAFALLDKTPDALLNSTLLTLLPGSNEIGLFDLCAHTAQTGEPAHKQLYYSRDGLNLWFDVTARNLEDGLVITFTDVSEAKKSELALEQTKADLQAVIDSSQTGIFVFSPVCDEQGEVVNFRFKIINRMVADLIGETPAAITGALASDWFASYRETSTFTHYKHTLRTGEPQRFDVNYNVDGLDVWFDVKSVKFGNDVLVTFTDYTDLKRAQMALEQVSAENQRQAELLNRVLDGSNSGIMAFESIRDEAGAITDFTFLSSNDAANRMVNWPAGELVGKRLLSVFPGNKESGLLQQYIKTAETGEQTQVETNYQLDGLDMWFAISAQKLGDGFVVTFSDISEVKRSAHFVEQSAAELQMVVDMSQTGIFLVSPVRNSLGDIVDFRFRLANRMLASYAGQEAGTVVGSLFSRWFPDYKTNGLFDAFLNTYQTAEGQRFDLHYYGSGIDAWLDILTSKAGDEVLVTFGDYTPLKQLQQQLESSIIDLQRSNANLEQFAYVASHDLQEPLRKIQAFGDIIETQYGPVIGEQGSDMIRRMQSAAARMQVLIKDVLAYSRIATRRDAIAPVNLNQLLAEVIDDLETAIADQQAIVTVGPLPLVTGDAGQLRQLFQNVLSNALKFTKSYETATSNPLPEGGALIRVTAQTIRGRESGFIVSTGDLDRLFHLIEIDDNGIGFEPHQADRIFQVFQRLHNRSTYQGTGIGLAVVKKVAENHNGYIQAIGRPHEGATFRVLLPV
jgi:signal transduction histidine kinase